jgi:hypothetical protein
VDPETTSTWDQSFTYAVNCTFSDKVSITLEVYNLSLHDWTAIGDRTYNGTGEWQSLTWEEVNICSGKCDGTSSYRFKYNGSILLTESGPTIAPPTPTPLPPTVQIFKDAMVKPAYGHYNDSFTYSVFTQLNQTRNITLEVFDISSYEWKEARENQSYTETGNWQLLSWANVTNVSAVDGAGVASYRFLFFDAGERRESEVFYGPELGLYPTPTPSYSGGDGGGVGISPKEIVEDVKEQLLGNETLQRELAKLVAIKPPELINHTVTPKRGSWHEGYNYSAVVEHPNRAEMWVPLEVYCPGKGVTHIISSREIKTRNNSETNRTTVDWPNVCVFSQEDAIASVKANESPQYYIRYNDGYNNGLWGPYLGPTLTNSPPVLSAPTVFPLEGTYQDIFVYKVNVTDEDGDDVWVTLHIVDSQGGWIYNKTHVMRGIESKMGMTELWIYNFTAKNENENENLSFFFTATDGIDYAKERKVVGPSFEPITSEEKQGIPGELFWPIIVVIAIMASIILGLHYRNIVSWWRIRGKRVIEEEIV